LGAPGIPRNSCIPCRVPDDSGFLFSNLYFFPSYVSSDDVSERLGALLKKNENNHQKKLPHQTWKF